MKNRNQSLYFEDILECIRNIEGFIGKLTLAQFIKNILVRDAVIRNLEVIGEACTHISDDVRKKSPEIPWKRMIGLRNIVIHNYLGIDDELIYKVATENLKGIEPLLKKILKSLSQ